MVVPGAHRRKCGFLLGHLSQTTGLHGLHAANVCGSGPWGMERAGSLKHFCIFCLTQMSQSSIMVRGNQKSDD